MGELALSGTVGGMPQAPYGRSGIVIINYFNFFDDNYSAIMLCKIDVLILESHYTLLYLSFSCPICQYSVSAYVIVSHLT